MPAPRVPHPLIVDAFQARPRGAAISRLLSSRAMARGVLPAAYSENMCYLSLGSSAVSS
jgi:hypothetical protein